MTTSNVQTIAVAGSTGFVGRHIVRELVERGHHVRALVRDTRKGTRVLPEEGVTEVVGDATKEEGVARLLDGASGVVNAIGIRREHSPDITFERLHVGVTRRLVEAASRSRASRFVQISALGTRHSAPTEYHRSKFEAEQFVRHSRLDWTIFRPSLVHGPDGEFVRMVRDWVLGRAAPRLFLPYFARIEKPEGGKIGPPRLVSADVQPVHVDDVAGAVADALENPVTIGEVYHLTGPETLSWPELLTTIRDAMPMTDSSKPVRPIPAPLGAMMARAAGAVGLGELLPFGPSEPRMAAEDSVAPTDKARAHFGFEPRGFRQSVLSYAQEL